MSKNVLEGELQTAFLLEAPKAFPELRLFRRNVMKIRVVDPMSGRVRAMRFAVPGQCNLYGICTGGLHVEIELKSATGSLEPDQRAWRDFCSEWCIPYALLKAKKGEIIPETIARWMVELRQAIPA